MSEDAEATLPARPLMRFRRASTPRMPPADARRQGDITRLAFQALGRERAIAFLNSDNSELGARPLDLATASEAGWTRVREELHRLPAGPAQEI